MSPAEFQRRAWSWFKDGICRMKPLTFRLENNELRIDQYPSAVAVKRIDGADADALEAMSLHELDLAACEAALQLCVTLKDREEAPLLLKTVWTGVLALYVKCFATGARGPNALKAEDIFDAPEALQAHEHYKNLKDKHLVHDVNAYSQGQVGVVVNPMTSDRKVADVVSIAIEAAPIEQDMQVVYNLVDGAISHVRRRRKELHDKLTAEYEGLDYAALMGPPVLQLPSADCGADEATPLTREASSKKSPK